MNGLWWCTERRSFYISCPFFLSAALFSYTAVQSREFIQHFWAPEGRELGSDVTHCTARKAQCKLRPERREWTHPLLYNLIMKHAQLRLSFTCYVLELRGNILAGVGIDQVSVNLNENAVPSGHPWSHHLGAVLHLSHHHHHCYHCHSRAEREPEQF